MQVLKEKCAPAEIALDAEMLTRAFEQFNTAGARLERKYELLARETESLRAQLREKDLEVKRAERLALLGETAAGVAHEVRNPLGAIKLFVSLLKKDLRDRPESLTLVEEIDKSINTLDNVVSNILQFTKEQGREFSPVNVQALIQEQAVHFSSMSHSSARIVLDLQGNPYVFGNEHSLRQVLNNLLLNAAQAVKQDGRIRVSTADRGERLELVVHDNGAGIPSELIERVFDPFVTTKNTGTGLGLAIVKKIVNQHGGEVAVQNDGGARFSLLLPRKQGYALVDAV